MEYLIVEETGYTEKSMSLMKSDHFVIKKGNLAIKMKTFETHFGVVARSVIDNNTGKSPCRNDICWIAEVGEKDLLFSTTSPQKQTHAPKGYFWYCTPTRCRFIYLLMLPTFFAHDLTVHWSLIDDFFFIKVHRSFFAIFTIFTLVAPSHRLHLLSPLCYT